MLGSMVELGWGGGCSWEWGDVLRGAWLAVGKCSGVSPGWCGTAGGFKARGGLFGSEIGLGDAQPELSHQHEGTRAWPALGCSPGLPLLIPAPGRPHKLCPSTLCAQGWSFLVCRCPNPISHVPFPPLAVQPGLGAPRAASPGAALAQVL